jgi:hypothetical protein
MQSRQSPGAGVRRQARFLGPACRDAALLSLSDPSYGRQHEIRIGRNGTDRHGPARSSKTEWSDKNAGEEPIGRPDLHSGVVPQARVELATFRLGGGCSIH